MGLVISRFFASKALEKQKNERREELTSEREHLAQLASTRRCAAAGMDHIRTMLSENDAWIRHCVMERPYMDAVNKTKVMPPVSFNDNRT